MSATNLYYKYNRSIVEKSVNEQVETELQVNRADNSKGLVIPSLFFVKTVLLPVVEKCFDRNSTVSLDSNIEKAMKYQIEYETYRISTTKPFEKVCADLILLKSRKEYSRSIIENLKKELKTGMDDFLSKMCTRFNVVLTYEIKKHNENREHLKGLADAIKLTNTINSLALKNMQNPSVADLKTLLSRYLEEKQLCSDKNLEETMNKLYPEIHKTYDRKKMKYLSEFLLDKYKLVIGQFTPYRKASDLLIKFNIKDNEIQYLEGIRRFYTNIFTDILNTKEYAEHIVFLFSLNNFSGIESVNVLEQRDFKKFKSATGIACFIIIVLIGTTIYLHRRGKV